MSEKDKARLTGKGGMTMIERKNVPIQSLIDHIKTAVDVDPWAKEMAEELLKEQEATMVIEYENMYTGLPITHCLKCGKSLDKYLYGRQHKGEINFCPYCGKAVKWE